MILIDKDQIRRNIMSIKGTRDLILVVKDNAYGFGLTKIAKIAYECGVNKFAVISIMEAIVLRKAYKDVFILLLGVAPKSFQVLKDYNITVSISSLDEFYLFDKNDIKMHIKLDMGMNRFGFKKLPKDIVKSNNVTGIYMHSYSTNERINNKLAKSFYNMCSDYNKLMHIGGSVMIDAVSSCALRVGYYVYKDAVSLYGKIIAIKEIEKGEGVGYESFFVASQRTRIGICNIGYAHGLSRDQTNAFVYINGRKYQIIGNKCMDCCFILIDESVELNNDVEFLGKNISLIKFAKMNNKNSYEALIQIMR